MEDQAQRLQALAAENERLRAEIRRLKGEPPQPTPRPPVPAAPDRSSERERREARSRRKRSKNQTLRVDREEVRLVERASLPADAGLKGYAEVNV